MKNIILILLLSFSLTGCSVLRLITAPFKSVQNTVPQQIDKSKAKEVCKGNAVFNEQGEIISCTKGYYRYDEGYQSKERKVTLKEKILQYLDKLVGMSFWIILGLAFLCPSALGFIFGRIIESLFGITKKSLDATIRGVQKFRKQGKNLDDALADEQDSDVKKEIQKIKNKLG